jgi:translation initiation factor SUI1
MDTLLNFDQTDVFADNGAMRPFGRTSKIHIRTQQQGRRWLTIIEGLDDDLDQARIARAMKKTLHCAAKAKKDEHENDIILLQGNHASEVAEWLVVNEVLTAKEAKERLVVHGV